MIRKITTPEGRKAIEELKVWLQQETLDINKLERIFEQGGSDLRYWEDIFDENGDFSDESLAEIKELVEHSGI